MSILLVLMLSSLCGLDFGNFGFFQKGSFDSKIVIFHSVSLDSVSNISEEVNFQGSAI